ncbi:MAG: ABC transporter ATP-binding protein [Candidatus Njordarchaeia archaeon]
MSEELVVHVENLTFTYAGTGGEEALKNVSFKLKKGEVLAVMGANGAGKTTLCFILSGIIPNMYGGTRKGKVRVLEFDPWDQPIYETAKDVGILLQDPETQLMMPDVFSELAFGPANVGVPKEEIERRIKWALKVVGLEGFEERHPRELSGGQKQRVALAAVLTMLPNLLVLDEPTAQLDPLGTTEVFQAINRLKEEGYTIIITSHKTEEISSLADKVLVLDRGSVVAYGSPREVFSDVNLLEKIGIEPLEYTEYFEAIKKSVNKNFDMPIYLDESVELARKLFSEGLLKVNNVVFSDEEEEEKEPLVEMKDVTFVYPAEPPVTALKNINLTIYKGDFIGIIGQNGSGKSTLVKNIIGLLKPTKGKIYFHGEDTSKYSVGQLARRIGLVLQNPDYQLFTISAEKEIEFGLKNIGVPEDEIEERITEALRLVGLEDKRDKYPFALSFGDRRKLSVATVIAMKPEIILLDEPTTAQDYRGRYMIADLAKEIHEKLGTTIVMITHDMNLVARYAKRIIVMADAEIIADGPTRKVFQMKDILKRAFLKPPQITRFAQQLADIGVNPEVLSVDEMLQTLAPSMEVKSQ